jgi:dienelactone hydrolase
VRLCGSEGGLSTTASAALPAAQPGIDLHRVFVWGDSLGSEAALPLGAHFPRLRHGLIGSVPSAADAIIPVEKIRGPIVLICGGSDRVWPSCAYTDAIVARLAAHHVSRQPTVLRHPDAGHFIGVLLPYLPDTQTSASPAGDAAARADGWSKLLNVPADS